MFDSLLNITYGYGGSFSVRLGARLNLNEVGTIGMCPRILQHNAPMNMVVLLLVLYGGPPGGQEKGEISVFF